MLHFLRRLAATARQDVEGASPSELVSLWLAMALASVGVPAALYPAVGLGNLADALASAALWKVLSPVLISGVLAVALWRWSETACRPCPTRNDSNGLTRSNRAWKLRPGVGGC
jgi:hypothetical protein